jgi:ABC-type amino acid transport substrate-binding protein
MSADVLRVGAALPDPPFELPRPRDRADAEGFDPSLMAAVAAQLGRELQLVRYDGADFDGIFAGLDRHEYDVVASGATITPRRQQLARFCSPYVVSGQSLVVRADSSIASTGDLGGRVLGVQEGNTSEPVADSLRAAGELGAVRRYPYDGIVGALEDVEHGVIDGFMKLEPVMRWLVRHRPELHIAQTRITDERLAVAVQRDDAALVADIDGALATLRADGTLAALGRHWLGTEEHGNGTEVVLS